MEESEVKKSLTSRTLIERFGGKKPHEITEISLDIKIKQYTLKNLKYGSLKTILILLVGFILGVLTPIATDSLRLLVKQQQLLNHHDKDTLK